MHPRGPRAGPCGAAHGMGTAVCWGRCSPSLRDTGILASRPAHCSWLLPPAYHFPVPHHCVLTHGHTGKTAGFNLAAIEHNLKNFQVPEALAYANEVVVGGSLYLGRRDMFRCLSCQGRERKLASTGLGGPVSEAGMHLVERLPRHTQSECPTAGRQVSSRKQELVPPN